ncbi:MAG: protein kinase [Anaerolineae bacterium]|nr:protein kinase [Anaerolineae bacterium]
MIGETLGGFRIVEQVGVGGMATVYKAYDAAMDRYVALKVLPDRYARDTEFRQRFEREAKAISHLEHPHILPVHSYGEDRGYTFLVMRYLPSGTLKERLEQDRLPLPLAASVLRQVADALDYAHERGVLHRDIKPSNMLMDDRDNVYLMDFGIAKIIEDSVNLTGEKLLGTPAYMSPEQCQGSQELTPACDEYSLGIVLYEMLTGSAPFQADTPVAIVYKHLYDPLPLPRQFRPNLPEAVETVVLKALSKDPASRYPSCTALADAFAAALRSSDDVTQSPTIDIAPPARRKPKSALPIILALVAALVIVGGLLLALTGTGRSLVSALFAGSKPTEESTSTETLPTGEWVDAVQASIEGREPDYVDTFDDPGSGWGEGSFPGGDWWDYQDGEYRVRASYRPQGECCIGPGYPESVLLTDFVLEIDTTLLEGEEGSIFVIIRFDDREGDQDPHYGVILNSDGLLSFYKNDGVNHQPLADDQFVTASRGFGGAANHLTIIAQGDRFAFLVNGGHILEVTDDLVGQGRLMFGAENLAPDTWLEASFDNLRIWNLDR